MEVDRGSLSPGTKWLTGSRAGHPSPLPEEKACAIYLLIRENEKFVPDPLATSQDKIAMQMRTAIAPPPRQPAEKKLPWRGVLFFAASIFPHSPVHVLTTMPPSHGNK